jgi:dihydrofolate synthase / folylpolyglutamate synthase
MNDASDSSRWGTEVDPQTNRGKARLAETFEEVEDALLSRWPETRLEPSLDRIRAFTELLGDPQRSYPVIHLTGTNGKTSTSRMIDTLLRALDLRTGRFTSPHVERMTERISVDGEPLTDEEFVRAFNDVAPYTHLVDADQEHPLSFFETVVGMAYAAFADAPVDVAVVEVGMGGSWDATNVADATVAVVLPVAVDHAAYLGETPADIAVEKAGIIKPGSIAVLAQQTPDVAAIMLERAAEVGATVAREGTEFGVVARVPAVGGQVVSLQGLRARYDDVFLPLHGAHQAQNAAVALAAVEAFAGDQALDDELVRAAFAEVTSPGRLEIVRRSPTIVLDAAHNPHGAEATAAALEDSFTFSPLVGVVGVMADKDHEGLLAAFEPHLAHLVCTQNSTDRALPAERLAATAREIFGADRVSVAPRLSDAIDEAAALAEACEAFGDPLGSGAVLVTGSVVTVGEARALLVKGDRR